MAIASNLGFPRIGANRELKWAVESYWAGKSSAADLQATAAAIRKANWLFQSKAGISHIPSGDFSFYDQVLDTTAMVGAVPERYGHDGEEVGLDLYFAMARGTTGPDGVGAMEMTKWFDTNYHYIVPEFTAGQSFSLSSTKPVDQFLEAQALGIHTRPVLVGPVTYLLLGKMQEEGTDPLSLLESLLPVYEDVLKRLAEAGAEWVQMDEPALGLTLTDTQRAAFGRAYARLAPCAPTLKLLVAVYFSDLRENMRTALALPVAGLHVDLVRGPDQLGELIQKLGPEKFLSLGVVDGRNVWRTNLANAIAPVDKAAKALGTDRILVAPSCSLLHSPVDLALESELDDQMRSWMAFATQKVVEVATIARAVNGEKKAFAKELTSNAKAMADRATSKRIHSKEVKARITAVTPQMYDRKSPFDRRKQAQHDALRLPDFPTTTIGSFPQTPQIRKARADHRKGAIDDARYQGFLREEIAEAVRFQEQVGLDVLVHGEAERNDMVEYFGEQMAGYTHSRNGWVQSYGSRCVKPPIIFGDVSRPAPMTVEWSTYAQSLTAKPMKGMLTGPVTMLQWSFVRDDQPRSETCKQLALAIRDEVVDLEKAGIRIIQIDEPALREGLPLRREDWAAYLEWAVDCFRLSAAGVEDRTQIHTHMCYAEFNDIIQAIADLDADVISIESSRSNMELLQAFGDFRYPNEIGPGVYDIHSPRVADEPEMERLLDKALEVIPGPQLWVNPDCGLKTRKWEEVKPSLEHLVAAAKALRAKA
ncbi:MAG: 5-methyltetrahydropteroyltriglutamate--homocysteine S-methyltransferase [Chloroflexota bacterium]